jgi:hypothetical protein
MLSLEWSACEDTNTQHLDRKTKIRDSCYNVVLSKSMWLLPWQGEWSMAWEEVNQRGSWQNWTVGPESWASMPESPHCHSWCRNSKVDIKLTCRYTSTLEPLLANDNGCSCLILIFSPHPNSWSWLLWNWYFLKSNPSQRFRVYEEDDGPAPPKPFPYCNVNVVGMF